MLGARVIGDLFCRSLRLGLAPDGVGLEGPLDEALVMACRAPRIDAAVEIGGRLAILMPEQLPHGLEAAGLGIKHDLRAQMAKLVGCKDYASPPCEVSLDEPGNRRLALRSPIDIYKDLSGR